MRKAAPRKSPLIKTVPSIAWLACLLLSTVALAHAGHRHDAKGSIEAIEANKITLLTIEGEKESILLNGETSFSRGEVASNREDVAVGERAVVIYEKINGQKIAIEVKLGPKTK
jgi:hypothetical protein